MEKKLQDKGQVNFLYYNQGQAFAKGDTAILAIVNLNGTAAHYMATNSERQWRFFQMPHLNTEKRAMERMGFPTMEAMHKKLFEFFDKELGWNRFPAGLFSMDGRGELASELRNGLIEIMVRA
jgi:hypothetical protein